MSCNLRFECLFRAGTLSDAASSASLLFPKRGREQAALAGGARARQPWLILGARRLEKKMSTAPPNARAGQANQVHEDQKQRLQGQMAQKSSALGMAVEGAGVELVFSNRPAVVRHQPPRDAAERVLRVQMGYQSELLALTQIQAQGQEVRTGLHPYYQSLIMEPANDLDCNLP